MNAIAKYDDDEEETTTSVAAEPATSDRIADDATRRVRRASAPLIASDRYRYGPVLGVGGMGEVISAHDTHIGREVAIKRMRCKATPVALARFLREARIQGRLEHPAIPPVHELAYDDDGRPFFVMKKLIGKTLAHLLRESPRIPRQRLLRAFVEVCNAIELAHTRGIIHRDLKPSNILLGELGEVYVLDWGIARELDGPERASTDCVGTIGYMAPEQILEVASVDGRADVYALGCLLYEILCGQPLHPKGDAGLRSTLGSYDARPSICTPVEVAPELDELCVLATAPDRADRITSARELGQAVERYLDGDRDLALRTSLARGHLVAAQRAFASGDGEDERRTAMREAGRALALDPTLVGAAELVGRLMLEPPRETPRAVLDELAVATEANGRRQERIGIGVHAGYFLLAAVLLVLGIRDPLYLGALAGLSALNVGLACAGRRRRTPALVFTIIVTNVLIIAMFARMFSPFLVAPGVAAVSLMAFAFHPAAARGRSLTLITVLVVLAVLAPWLAEMAGLISSTTSIDNGAILMRSTMDGIANVPVEPVLGVFVVVLLGIAAGLAASVARAERRARCHVLVQAWQLRQLLSVPAERSRTGA